MSGLSDSPKPIWSGTNTWKLFVITPVFIVTFLVAATLARRLVAALVVDSGKIEQDDLSFDHNTASVGDREKWPSDKRNDDPLPFGTHPDFLPFAPDGPLPQITIEQMRLLKERAQ